MGGIAFVFAGQGAQAPGMGRSLYEASPAARDVFRRADEVRPGTSRQCFEGTEAELKVTKNTQPCLYTVELAAAAALAEAGLRGDMAAGFSLGELSALSYAGAADFETGLRLVMRRGELMQSASEARKTSMAAVLRLEKESVESLCARFREVYPVNYNCPGQIAVSGAAEEMEDFLKAVKAAGGRAVPLKVSGAFHSPFMGEAAAAFREELERCPLGKPAIPLYANPTGAPYGPDLKGTLAQQMDHPVLWEATVRNMTAAGADTFVELGPGNTLCGLIRKTDPTLRCFGAAGAEDLKNLLKEISGC